MKSILKFGIIGFLFLLVLLNCFGDYANEFPMLNLFFGFCIVALFYSLNKISFFLLIKFFIAYVWCICSLYYIENGNWISEQGVFGENIGALPRYIFYMGIFLFSAYCYIAFKTNKMKNITYTNNINFFEFVTKNLFILVVVLCVIIGALYGFPLLSGNTRFSFYQEIGHLDKTIFAMPIVAFMLGVLYSLKNEVKYFLYIFILICFLILFSDKFSGVFGIFVYFIMGFYLSKNAFNKSQNIGFDKKVLFFYFPILFILLLFIVSAGYVAMHGAEISELKDKILSRAFGLQAHVWYGIDFNLIKNYTEFNPNIFWLHSDEPVQPAGLEYLMYEIANENFVDNMRNAGIRFTNGYPAIVLISFGYFYSFFILILLGMVLGFFLHYIYQKIQLLQPCRLFVSLVFYNNIIINIFIMGEIYYIYKPLGWICASIILVDIMFLKHKNFKFKGLKNG